MNKVKFGTILFGIICVSLVCYIVFADSFKQYSANEYYQVYLSGKVLGLIESKDELYDLIDEEQKEIKEQYNVDKVYPPSGLEIQNIITYNDNVIEAKSIYEEIKDLDPFTIEGYQVTVTKDKESTVFYILNKDDINIAIKNTVLAFVDEDNYDEYLKGTQKKITDEGKELINIYFDREITVKKTYVSTEENIITNSDDLSMYFLFGTTNITDVYTVSKNDTIESIAYKNQLGVSDFLVANPDIAGENALLAVGQEVRVAPIEPVANVVVESYETNNQTIKYDTKVEYDKNLDSSQSYTKQSGSNGLSKVTYATQEMNGVILNTKLVTEEVITQPTDKVIVVGANSVVYVGSSTYWAWPTSKPYRISSKYGYRVHPVYHEVRFHDGVDITGTPNKYIYAIQSGTITTSSYSGGMGNYVKIDHGNGYSSIYEHLKKRLVSAGDKVEKGQLIGIMGCTGTCTGTHLHFTMIKNGTKFNPLTLYD